MLLLLIITFKLQIWLNDNTLGLARSLLFPVLSLPPYRLISFLYLIPFSRLSASQGWLLPSYSLSLEINDEQLFPSLLSARIKKNRCVPLISHELIWWIHLCLGIFCRFLFLWQYCRVLQCFFVLIFSHRNYLKIVNFWFHSLSAVFFYNLTPLDGNCHPIDLFTVIYSMIPLPPHTTCARAIQKSKVFMYRSVIACNDAFKECHNTNYLKRLSQSSIVYIRFVIDIIVVDCLVYFCR